MRFARHLPCWLTVLSTCLVSSGIAVGDTPPEEKKEERRRTAYFIDVLPQGSAEKAMIKYREWEAAHAGAIPLDSKIAFGDLTDVQQELIRKLMVDMYGAAGQGAKSFKYTALIIAKGLENPSEDFKKRGLSAEPLPGELSILMAQARDLWIEDAIRAIGERNDWKIARSDSGNMTSGMKSDLDQTFYVFKWDEKTQDWVRNPDLDGEFIKQFEAEWAKPPQSLTLEMLDIASIEGKNRFPDPRNLKISDYSKEFRRTITALRNTPGAYTTYGAVLQQMQLRALGGIIAAAQSPDDPAKRRAFQTYGPADDKPGKEKAWTKSTDFDQELALETMFGKDLDPKIMQGLAFGAAVANALELHHYMGAEKFESKYHLRVWDDGLVTHELVDSVTDAEADPTARKVQIDYTKLTPEQRKALNQELLVQLFPDDEGARRLHELALDSSAALRNVHKEDYDKVEMLAGRDKDSITDLDKQRAAFEELATALFDTPPNQYKPGATEPADVENNNRLLDMAEQQHRQLANAFCLETIFHTAPEIADLLLADPDVEGSWINEKKVRPVVQGAKPPDVDQVKWDADWEKIRLNLAGEARQTLLYAMYDLGPVESAKLRDRIKERHPGDKYAGLRAEIDRIWASRNWEVFKGVIENRDTYRRFYTDRMKAQLPLLNERVQRHLLTELGFDHVEDARMAGMWLSGQKVTWNARKFATNAVWDPGTIDAFAQVMRTYFESGGDPEAVRMKVADEMLLALPVIGQLESARRGGITGIAMMGLAMASPQFASAMLVYSLGEAAYAIYDVEYRQPVSGNVAECVFRGFVGPEQYDFGGTGATTVTWGQQDQDKLDALEAVVAKTSWLSGSNEPPTDAELAVAQQDIALLKTRRAAAVASGGGAWMGGMITGVGAQTTQKFIDHYLLDDIEPVIGYFTKAIVDLRVLESFDPETFETQIAALRDAEKSGPLEDRLRASADLNELQLQKQRFDLATKWWDFAQRNPEVMYRLRRDSIYNGLNRKYTVMTDPHVRKWVDEWVDEWLETNEAELIDDLIDIGLLDESARGWRERRDKAQALYDEVRSIPVDRPRALPAIPQSPLPMEEIKTLVIAEVGRSRSLYAAYKKQEEERFAVNERNLAQGDLRYQMEMTRARPEHLRENESMRDLIAGLRWAAAPRSAPALETTIYGLPAGDAAGESQDPELRFEVATNLTVDTTLYYQPYGTRTDYVDLKTARAALRSGTLHGMPLLAPALEDLRLDLAENTRDEDEVLVAVTSAFADDAADLTEAMPETYAGLPSVRSDRRNELPEETRPLGPTVIDGAPRYLLAQTVVLVPVAAPAEEAPPAEEEFREPDDADGYAIGKYTIHSMTSEAMCGTPPDQMVEVTVNHYTVYTPPMPWKYLRAHSSKWLLPAKPGWYRNTRRKTRGLHCMWHQTLQKQFVLVGQGMTEDDAKTLYQKLQTDEPDGEFGQKGWAVNAPDHETVIQMIAQEIYDNPREE